MTTIENNIVGNVGVTIDSKNEILMFNLTFINFLSRLIVSDSLFYTALHICKVYEKLKIKYRQRSRVPNASREQREKQALRLAQSRFLKRRSKLASVSILNELDKQQQREVETSREPPKSAHRSRHESVHGVVVLVSLVGIFSKIQKVS